MRLYCIYDRVAEEAGPVLQCGNDGVAIRAYRQALQQVAPCDQDAYWLYYLGDMDSKSMQIKTVEPSRIEMEVRQYDLIEDGRK